ncbi:MAG TPA: NAD-dependent epimerase/dehydratase family protein [Gemmatimonadaceae bacterium]|nr:NAD-dependent epimerase/dehydratase family protein [Gemmatimonadaceae bacterium]
MRVLVTGGTGVVGVSTVTALTAQGHQVRLLSRHAERDARQWPTGVEPWPGDVAEKTSLQGAADGCDAVLHLVAIVEEDPPKATFERVNVNGTLNLVEEAHRAGVARFVYVSSLGAERGESPYHRSKFEGEQIVRGYPGDWLIVRPGSVYGPGDEQISLLLRMVRTLPALPVIGDGQQRFQPVWHLDLAEALVRAVERRDLTRRTLDIAGPETTSQQDLLDRLERITARSPVRVPLPDFATAIGIKGLEMTGIGTPFNESQLTMLREGNVLDDPSRNALTTVLGVEATPLDRGLELLADAQVEQTPREGVGALQRKRFWVDVVRSRMTPDELIAHVRTHFGEMMPGFVGVAVEPGTAETLDLDETLTLSLPLRGHIQVRVAELEDRRITLVTLEGHPLAGLVRFTAGYEGDALRFEVSVYDRASNVLDLVMMRTVGDLLQNRTWETLAENVARASGGEPRDGVQHESQALHGEEARSVEEWADGLVVKRKRAEKS